ncbi:gastrula zinc finger protein XlCGF26.1-like isoform X1 [Microcaecilia unicolor]|uniref:Gastrula zinc finger protein XlCGF26.1-like isoform X1 n=1 Tax=Microcaecilia unicolor TaxID=1415580 RepID=A0A6P7XBT8_9AMPH|nr:gastrula zinc finger protein XlCGF26.1-like isoform X1 [Microcaecilia unicolor]
MPVGAAAQMQVKFEDIAVSFSQEEWEYLDEEQKELYREVMKENYQILISLGTGSSTFNPKIISLIERGEEPYIRDEPGSEEREPGKSSCSGCSSFWKLGWRQTVFSRPESGSSVIASSLRKRADNQITEEIKIEKNEGDHPVEMEEIQRRSENVCENISQGSKRINTRNCEQESMEQRDPVGSSMHGVSKCEKNDRELSNIPEDQEQLAERPFQTTNSDQVTNQLYQEVGKRKTHQKEFTCTAYNRNISFICPKKGFPLFSEVQIHKRNHRNEKLFTCIECNKSFTQLLALRTHQMVHTGDKLFACTECNKIFTQLSNLNIHKKIHMGEKLFTCSQCNKSFSRLSNLKMHQMIHTGEKPFPCSVCNKSFTRLSKLKLHCMIHTGDKPFPCIECNKSFADLSILKTHQMTHMESKPFPCFECNKSFCRLSQLKLHLKIHMGEKPFSCIECNKSFTRLSSLKYHQMIHTGDKPFPCSECNKSFTRLSQLKVHQKIHTGEKQLTCTECNKSFIQRSNLKKHQMIHTGEKPFTCTECNKCFTRLSSLKIHQKTHTGDINYI